jgi:hypothetical protein
MRFELWALTFGLEIRAAILCGLLRLPDFASARRVLGDLCVEKN